MHHVYLKMLPNRWLSFVFSWDDCNALEKLETMHGNEKLFQEETGCIMVDMEMGKNLANKVDIILHNL